MNILFFDTETTGKASFKLPPEHESQPRLVQLAAVLQDESGQELASLNLIIRAVDFEIPAEASSIHGITTEMSRACGVPLLHALLTFESLVKQSSLLVAHNIEFDRLIMRGECARMRVPFDLRATFCTMAAMTPICKLPGKYNDYKWPKLQEAHVHAFGHEFDDAHDAMADVSACAAIFRWLKQPEAKA